MIEKTTYKVILPKDKKEYKMGEIEVDIQETETKTRRVTLNALDSAISMLQNNIDRYKKMIKEAENNLKNIKEERSKVNLEIKKYVK